VSRYEKTDLSAARQLVSDLREASRMPVPSVMRLSQAANEITWLCARIESAESSRDLLHQQLLEEIRRGEP